MTVTTDLMKSLMRRFAAGVTIVTAVRHDGTPAGMTATAFTSVSLDPPRVLICVNTTARTIEAIDEHEGFVVNILSAAQQDVATVFAGRGDDKFERVAWEPGVTGAPVLSGCLATVECRVSQAVQTGTHIVYIGEVVGGSTGDGTPLIYYEGGFRELGEAD